jgi:glycosyltransferase involved in cell wall biosynthesis
MDISVVIPCHNSGAYIEEAISSIFAQTGEFAVRKIVIVDDASTEPTTESALARIAQLPAIEIVRHEKQKGPGAARNSGVRRIETEWLSFLDADDVLTERSFEVRALAARQYPDCDWIGGDIAIWREDGSIEDSFFRTRARAFSYLKSTFEHRRPERFVRPVTTFIDTALTHTCATLCRTSLFRTVGGFDETLLKQQDYNLFLRMSIRTDFVFVPEIVALYRQHDRNWTRDSVSVNAWRALALIRLLESKEFGANHSQIRQKISRVYQDSAVLLRGNHKFFDAMNAAVKSLRYDPSNASSWRSLAASMLGR